MVGPNSPYEDFEELEEAANEVGLTFVDVWNPDGVKTFGHHLQERSTSLNVSGKAVKNSSGNLPAGSMTSPSRSRTSAGRCPRRSSR